MISVKEQRQLLKEDRQGETFYVAVTDNDSGERKLFIESYGCAMYIAKRRL